MRTKDNYAIRPQEFVLKKGVTPDFGPNTIQLRDNWRMVVTNKMILDLLSNRYMLIMNLFLLERGTKFILQANIWLRSLGSIPEASPVS